MQKVLILKGLPGSGKTTYAKALLDGILSDENGSLKWVRVNKDELRSMLHNGKWSKQNEKYILKIRDNLIFDALSSGHNVIVDDTNFAPSHETNIRNTADLVSKELNHDVKVEVKFFDTPLEECISRDLQRRNSVGEKVIRDMYNRYLRPKPVAPVYDKALPNAIITDLDGTLALMTDRGPFEWSRVGEDLLNEPVANLLVKFIGAPDEDEPFKDVGSEKDIPSLIIVSGRDECCRAETERWLAKYNINYDYLFMRPEGDNRKDAIMKKEIYDNQIKGKANILFVLDDRDQVVELWRSLGLTCLQVADGNF